MHNIIALKTSHYKFTFWGYTKFPSIIYFKIIFGLDFLHFIVHCTKPSACFDFNLPTLGILFKFFNVVKSMDFKGFSLK